MAGKLRHWREKGGRFYARVAIPKELIQFVGKSELIEPLGGDRRSAMRRHPGAVARLQSQITAAARRAALVGATQVEIGRFPMSPEQLAASLYRIRLELDERGRTTFGYALVGIDDGYVERLREGIAGKLGDADLSELVGTQIEHFRRSGNVTAVPGSLEWRRIAHRLYEAELQAIARIMERDEGDFSGEPPATSILRTALPEEPAPPVPLRTLFDEYIKSRQALGKHRDGAKSWERSVGSLIKLLGHSDARRITKRDLNNWLERLLEEGKSAKTLANVYLASIRAILRWAH